MKPRRRPSGTVSLERALSKLGIASRTEARRLIREGRVSLHGRVETDPRKAVRPETAAIAVDGSRAGAARRRVVALHKPCGVVCTRSDPDGRPTVYDLIGDDYGWLGCAGRLDLDSSGLIILTNDTRLAARLTEPAAKVPKTYRVKVEGSPGAEALERLRRGIELDGKPARVEAVRIERSGAGAARLEILLAQGMNRQIRRMCEAVGHPVLELQRRRIGGLDLETTGLKPGECRELGPDEVARLFEPPE